MSVNKDLPGLLGLLGSVDDERARSCAAALTGRNRDVARALAIATGSPVTRPDSEIGRLRQLSQLVVPSQVIVDEIAIELRAAAAALDRTAGPRPAKRSRWRPAEFGP